MSDSSSASLWLLALAAAVVRPVGVRPGVLARGLTAVDAEHAAGNE